MDISEPEADEISGCILLSLLTRFNNLVLGVYICPTCTASTGRRSASELIVSCLTLCTGLSCFVVAALFFRSLPSCLGATVFYLCNFVLRTMITFVGPALLLYEKPLSALSWGRESSSVRCCLSHIFCMRSGKRGTCAHTMTQMSLYATHSSLMPGQLGPS